MEAVNLSTVADAAIEYDKELCIICQKYTQDKLVCTQHGCDQIISASETRQDVVFKRVKTLRPGTLFKYHVTNPCYKGYTNSTKLAKLKEKQQEALNQSLRESSSGGDASTQSATPSITRSQSNSMRTPPSVEPDRTTVYYQHTCIICGNKSVNREFGKYRICESNRAKTFLAATSHFQDDVFRRCCDLQDEHAVFGSDVYYHKQCMCQYIHQYERSISAKTPVQLNAKQRVWNEIVDEIELGLRGGKGYELSTIRDHMNSRLGNEGNVQNRDVKIFLYKQFNHAIDFAYSDSARKCIMVFYLLGNEANVLAERIRSLNPVQVVAAQFRSCLHSYDFDLDDRFCDANDLKQAWSKMDIPEPIMQFYGHLFNFNPATYRTAADQVIASDMQEDVDDAEQDEEEAQRKYGSLSVQRCRKVQTMFQHMFYIYHSGRKRTPMSILNAEFAHSLGRGGKIFVTSLNRQALAMSYTELRRYQHDMAAFTVNQNKADMKLPAHFDPGNFTSAAMDNWDHEGANSSEHDTVCVLYQQKPKTILSKPKRSATSVVHGPKALKEELPCQHLQQFEENVKKYDLPTSYRGHDQPAVYDDIRRDKRLSDIAWAIGRLNLEVTDSCIVDLVYPSTQTMRSWSASNAIWTDDNVPVKEVAFTPIVPHDINKGEVVYTELKNIKSLCSQLGQSFIPVYADEKVYSLAKIIQLRRPEEFKCIILCLGTFHTAKNLLKCCGRSIEGSGAEYVWLETGIYGPSVIQTSILNGGHYARSLDAQKILAEAMLRLLLKEFFTTAGVDKYVREFKILASLHSATKAGARENSKKLLDEFKASSTQLISDFDEFIESRVQKYENFKFWWQYLSRFQVVLDLLRADREGSWELHLDAMQRALYEFSAWGCTNYLRWGTVYLEDCRNLPQEVYENFAECHSFSVKDKPGVFTAVGGDQKLEQTINLSSKCSDSIIGHCKRKQFVAQWDLIFHEMMGVNNLLREITGVHEHTSEAYVHHESSQSYTDKCEENIQNCVHFIEERGSPFSTDCPKTLHNFVTKVGMPEDVRGDLLNVLDIGKEGYEHFHHERFITRNVRLDSPISRRNIKTMISVRNRKPTPSVKQTVRQVNITDKSLDIARHRLITTSDLLKYDVVPSPMIFDADGYMTHPEKSLLLRELELVLTDADMHYKHHDDTAFIIDVMALVRRLPLQGMKSFRDLLTLMQKSLAIYHEHGRCDYVFDIYTGEPSIKDQERERRSTAPPILLTEITPESPLPQMANFWPSQQNKMMLEQLIYKHVSGLAKDLPHPTVVSQLSMHDNDLACTSLYKGNGAVVPELCSQLDEADLRLILHTLHCAKAGYKTCVVLSSDTDVAVALLYHYPTLKEAGLSELWMRAGCGKTVRYIPLHILHERQGQDVCNVLPALHSLTGCDATSKVGTKKAALKAQPTKLLRNFGRELTITPETKDDAEKFLVLVLSETSQLSSFTELRAHIYHHSKASSHQNLPPTSESLLPHIMRAWFCAYSMIHLFQPNILDPLHFGYQLENDCLVPVKGCKTLNMRWTVTCNCGKCARATCPCRMQEVGCTPFCKCMKKKDDACTNPYN